MGSRQTGFGNRLAGVVGAAGIVASVCGVTAPARADLAVGTYAWQGYVISTTGTNCTVPAGTGFSHFLNYAGAGKKTTAFTLNLSSPAGGAAALSCTRGSVPAGGLNGATVTFTCAYTTTAGTGTAFPETVSFVATPSTNKAAFAASFTFMESPTCSSVSSGLLIKQ